MVTSAFATRPGAGSGAGAARARLLAIFALRLDTWSSSTRPVKRPHSRLPASIADQPLLVIFVVRRSCRCCACRTLRREQRARPARTAASASTKAERNRLSIQRRAVLDDSPCASGPVIACALSSAPPPRSATSAEIVELRPPAPFEVVVDGFGIGAIVVAEQLDPDRNRRLPAELRIIAGAVREAGVDVEQRMGERRLIFRRSRRRAAAAAGGGTPASCGRAAPSRGRSASVPAVSLAAMIAAVARSLCSPSVAATRAFGGDRPHFLADPAVDRRRRDRIARRASRRLHARG